MSNNIVFKINEYTMEPAPMIALTKNFIRTGSGEVINVVYNAEITGVLTTLSIGCIGGIGITIDLLNEMRSALCNCSCADMELTCNDEVLLKANVRINSIQFDKSNDNWVFTIPYSMSVEWDSLEETLPSGSEYLLCHSCLRQVNETWEVSYLDGYHKYILDCSGFTNPEYLSVSHNVSATAVDCCVASGDPIPGWEVARSWVLDHIGYDADMVDSSGVFGFDASTFSGCEHVRVKNIDKYNGSFSVNETWIAVSNSGSPTCLEEFTIETTSDNTRRTKSHSISGTITGLEKRDADFNLITTKFESALACWSGVEPILYERIECAGNSGICPVNPIPVSSTVGKNPVAGVVTYNYSYDDRPLSLISGALSESINFSDTRRSEQYAPIPILGRSQGPLIMSCGSTNEFVKSISISAVLPYPSGCAPATANACSRFMSLLEAEPNSETEEFLCCYEAILLSGYDVVIRNNDSSSYDINSGAYSRSVSWVVQNCNDGLPGGYCD